MPCNSLIIDQTDLLPRNSYAKRIIAVNEAISWPSGTIGNPCYSVVWNNNDYEIRLGKPGKEAAPGYNRCTYKDKHKGNNPNDMIPEIFMNGQRVLEIPSSFTEIFDELQKLHEESIEASELVACLIFRSAFMIDHIEISLDKWRYSPPADIITEINGYISEIGGVPAEVFLAFIDTIALNEDVKYHTLGYNIKDGYGRENNLLTCVHILAVLLNKARMSKLAGGFSSRPAGVSKINKRLALEIFSMLSENV